MSLLRRLLYLILATITATLAFYLIELLLADLGLFQLLGVREHGFLGTALILSWVGSVATWYLARDVAIGSTGTHLLSEGEWPTLVASLAKRCGLAQAPDVGVYPNPGYNAFVAGRSKGQMLLGLSQGLVDAGPGPAAVLVITHQLLRIARGDVVTQLLLQGFVSIFTLFPTRMFATFLGTSLRTAEDETPTDRTEGLLVSLLEMLITPYTSLLVRFYARGVELHCDRLAVKVLGLDQVSKGFTTLIEAKEEQPYREIFLLPLKFSGQATAALNLLLYHAHLPQRLARLAAQAQPTAV